MIWLVICFGAAAVGTRFPPGSWYEGLVRPAWTPPNSAFGPVWTVLYVCMAIAAWLVWQQSGFRGAVVPLTLFLVQLALNTAWSWLFFGLHEVGWALVDIVLLSIGITVTMRMFYARHRLAGLLLAPYLAWVLLATVLNWQIWRLNPTA